MTNDSCDTVVFDLGGVLIDWDPRLSGAGKTRRFVLSFAINW
jgi:hypothetical protein